MKKPLFNISGYSVDTWHSVMPELLTTSAKSRRLARLIAEENKQPLGWFFVSFCDNEGPLGAVIVEAHGELTAAREASKRGINPLAQGAHPGGDIACTPLDNKKDMKRIPADMLNRLISERELRRRLDGKRANE